MNDSRHSCWRCSSPLTGMILPVSRREECVHCRAEIHVCRMCHHYRHQPRNWCTEERAELPTAADLANFCDYFQVTTRPARGPSEDSDQAARGQLDALFGGGDEGPAADSADEALKKLFGDD